MASKLFTTFFFFLQFFFSDLFALSVSPLASISSACEILSDSGYFSMGLTLQLAIKDLPLEEYQELTIFAPSDQAFTRFGQPSLLDLKYQLSPTRFTREEHVPIPTLKPNSYLVLTNSSRSGGKIWINNVAVHDSPVFDDGSVVIYGSDEFFASLNSSIPNLILSPESIPIPSSATRDAPIPNFPFNIFELASSLLISRGFLIMATFLALQVNTIITVLKVKIGEPFSELKDEEEVVYSSGLY